MLYTTLDPPHASRSTISHSALLSRLVVDQPKVISSRRVAVTLLNDSEFGRSSLNTEIYRVIAVHNSTKERGDMDRCSHVDVNDAILVGKSSFMNCLLSSVRAVSSGG